MQKGSAAKFYKSAIINEKSITVFIDFESECSLITREQAEVLHLELKALPKAIVLTVFGGTEILVFADNCNLLTRSGDFDRAEFYRKSTDWL